MRGLRIGVESSLPVFFVCRSNLFIINFVGLVHPVSKAVYVEIDEKLEKCYKILDIIITKVIPIGGVVSKFIACFVVYFTTDSGNNAFELPIPGTW